MRVITTIVFLTLAGCVSASGATVRTGLDCINERPERFQGRRIGIIANQTAYDARGRHIVEVFKAIDGAEVVALFSPEHGLYGTEGAGQTIDDVTDPAYGLPVYSLYGRTRKPTEQMLRDVDVLVFDIQDVGARFYTYTSTMSLAMEAAAEQGKQFVVLDRPNPITGLHGEGPVLELEFASFVGMHPIPVRHAMTVGELARLFNGQRWLAGGVQADLVVIPMRDWHRRLWYDQTGLTFRKPSPNIPDLDTAIVYPGLCLLEGTNISEGRGTTKPFLQFGAPWLDAERLARRLNALHLIGVDFAPTAFTPTASKHAGAKCHGVQLTVTDRDRFEPFFSGVSIVCEVYQGDSEHFEWRAAHFDRLCGTSDVREAIIAGDSVATLRERWRAQCAAFEKLSRPYLLYAR
jgi:uncharacterized protein YbbC (DUF1343 family)